MNKTRIIIIALGAFAIIAITITIIYFLQTKSKSSIQSNNLQNEITTQSGGGFNVETKSPSVDLSEIKAQGLLKVTSEPSGAIVYIAKMNKKFITPFEVWLDEGDYEISAHMEGYDVYDNYITIDKDNPLTLSISMDKSKDLDPPEGSP